MEAELNKENEILGRTSHRNSRRSSILKDPSGRKPLESLESNLERRRSLKRVSFADSNIVKLGDAAAVVEPLEHFSKDQDREQNDHRKENSKYTSGFIEHFKGLSSVCCSQPQPLTVGAVASCEDIPLKDDTTDPQDFLAKFLNLAPSVSVTAGETSRLTQGIRTHKITMDKGRTCPADHVAKLMQGDMTDMELTNPASQVSRLNQGNMTKKITIDMEITNPASQVAWLIQDGMTDMEMTFPVSQVDRLTHGDMTEKVNTSMEMTCPVSQVAKLTHGEMTEKINIDMEMTCPVSQVAKLTQGDMTEKMNTDMEMTCPISQVAKLTQCDMTEKVNADMEMTCPVSQVAKLTHGEMTEKINIDMEMTCPVSQVAKLTQCDMTEKVNADMEMICPVSQVVKLTQGDMTEKINIDMEMTCPVSQVAKLTQGDMTEKVNADMEMTCPVSQVAKLTQGDMTEKINTDMEMTCLVSQVAKLTWGEMTEKIMTHMETSNRARHLALSSQYVTPDMDMSCPRHSTADLGIFIPRGPVTQITQDDLTSKVTAGLESASSVVQVFNSSRNSPIKKITVDKEVTFETDYNNADKKAIFETNHNTAEKEVTFETDHKTADKEETFETDLSTADKEVTFETDHIATDKKATCETDHITTEIQDKPLQRKIKDMECNSQVPDLSQNDAIQKVSAHLKITPRTRQMTRLTRDNPGQVIIADKELNHPTGQVDSLRQHHPFQKKTKKIEFSSPVFQNATFIHDDMTKTMTADIEMKCLSQVISGTENDLAQRKITDIEGTFPADQVTVFTQNDQIQRIIHKEAVTQLENKTDPLLPDQSKDLSSLSHLDGICNFSPSIFQSFSVKPKDCEKENDTESKIKQNGFDDADNISLNYSEDKICRKESLAKKALPTPDVQKDIDKSQLCGKRVHSSVSTDEPLPKCFVSDVNHSSSSHTCPSPPQVGCHSLFLPQDESHLKSMTQIQSYSLSPSKIISQDSSLQLPLPQGGPHSLTLSQVDPLPLTGSHSSYLSSHKEHFLLNSNINEGMSTVSNIPEDHGAEELVNDINLSLVNISDNSTEISPLTGDVNDKVSSQAFVPRERKVKEQNRRESLAACTVDQVMPLITSFIERASVLHNTQSNLEMSANGSVCSRERSLASLSFQYMNENTNLTLHQTDKCTTKVPLLSSPSLDINSIANLSKLDPEHSLAFSASHANHCTHKICSHTDMILKSADKMSKTSGDEIFSGTQGYDADSAGSPIDKPKVWIEVDHCEENKSDGEKMLYKEVSLCKVSDKIENQLHCSRGCCLTPGTLIFTPSDYLWVVKDIYEGERYLMLQNSPLELGLNVIRYNSHWRVSSAAWSPQASKVSTACGKLILNVLGCRLESAVAKLDGLLLCEIGDILSKVSAVYQDIFNMMIELHMVKTSYLTLFLQDSIKVTLFNLEGHVSVDLLLQLQPPAPNTDELYSLHPCATITVGNLRHQTVEETMAGVVPGPRQLLRLLQAVNFIVQSEAH
ncbi:uncharacterized protein [Panulirus ornatus]|uniref:uncharacterized protein isoform X2 n=1 Tax=Panulirus ornatus TaxID=150431 RepID=UPI003A85684E